MRQLAEALAAAGHAVTYVTRKQWPDDAPPDVPDVTVIAVSPDEPLYGPDGNRTIGEPLRFGAGVFRHLLRHGRDYDIVHTASFPYFSMLAAGAARRHGGYAIVGDWHELWSPEYWRSYVGGIPGRAAELVQRACARVPHHAFTFSRLHADRLVAEGYRGTPETIWEEWASDARDAEVALGAAVAPVTPPRVVFAGRLIAEKQAPLAVEAMTLAARRVPGLRGMVFGDGPERALVDAAVARSGGVVEAPGFVPSDELHTAMREATCLLAPSRREGYGLIVIEAASLGVPCILASGPDNAATELVEDGVNGCVVDGPTPSASELADAIVRVVEGGSELRARTAGWHRAHLERVLAQDPLARIEAAYVNARR